MLLIENVFSFAKSLHSKSVGYVSAVARAAISLTHLARGHIVYASYFIHLMLDVIQEYFLVSLERRLLQYGK